MKTKISSAIPSGKESGKNTPEVKAEKPSVKEENKIVVSTELLPERKSSPKKGAKKTMEERIVSALRAGKSLSNQRKQGGFLTLKEIYKRTKVTSVGDKAAIRGILNRDFMDDEQSKFVRNPNVRGSYVIREEETSKVA